MFRVWAGTEGQPLRRGVLCPSLNDALHRAKRLALNYTVRIEVDRGQWHVFEETANTILGPGFDVEQESTPGEPVRALSEAGIMRALRAPSEAGIRPLSDAGIRAASEAGVRPLSEAGIRAASDAGIRPSSETGIRASSEPGYANDWLEHATRATTQATSRATTDSGIVLELPPIPAGRAPSDPGSAERRRAPRAQLPAGKLTEARVHNGNPAELLDISWTGARVSVPSSQAPHAGELVVLDVRAFGVAAQLAGRVRWARRRECGLEFDWTLMTKSANKLLLHIFPDSQPV